jgi:hypothetical protein
MESTMVVYWASQRVAYWMAADLEYETAPMINQMESKTAVNLDE